ncbi:GNAT family N-acetyltransferase [Streptomyces sp. ICBB 8177]|uniref:GNAT family N-acetyltransferase n=1 Tax=Streptomyces sp. ICBB 8177 TaxID=563922 RepID=UPI000D67E03E|nr:GNAT family N-acetyltransferase [Streptomyces sp. ICBB 8177]PWI42050.1 GNAT family N-acetyltransferase [Streptomyces sp. ICBB 8177]
MTTTLRPAGPESREPDGARSRDFTVCVNSRPVGSIRLATDRRYGPRTGRVVQLRIDERDRRRGRGTVAALAAEEVLRGWGCRQVEASVPAEAPAALRLMSALGYTERNRAMVKALGEEPSLPPGVTVRAMGADDYAVWHARTRDEYVDDWVARGLTRQRAVELADADYAATLPEGHLTPDTALRVLGADGADVGWLWVRLRADEGRPAWVYLVEVAEPHRGRGHGRTLMLTAERECLAAGVRSVGLNVYTANSAAMRLYESLGYRPTSHEMTKSLL